MKMNYKERAKRERDACRFTLKDILDLLEPTGNWAEQTYMLTIVETGRIDARTDVQVNSTLLWTQEMLDRKVSSIDVEGGQLAIYLPEDPARLPDDKQE